jgi:Spy/CpxP family protein refolding chaperone
MKKLIITVAIAIATISTISAQEMESGAIHKKEMKNKTPQERAKAGANHAEKKLSLTAEQKTKWEAASLERINANEPLRVKMKGSTTPDERKQIHTSVKANNKKFDDSVNSFLTAEQKTKFEQQKKEHKEKRKDKMKGKGKEKADELDLDLED